MEEVLFYKGLKAKYNKALYGNGIYFATDTKEIIVDGVSYGSVDIDDELTEISNNPVKGSAIYKAIKDTITDSIKKAPFGATLRVINTGNNVYQIALVDAQGNILNDLNNSTIIGDQSGTVDMSGLSFTLLNEQNLQIKNGQKAEFKFSFDVRDKSGSSLGLPGKIVVYKGKISDNVIVDEYDVEPGQINIEVSQYGLEEGIKTEFNFVASTEVNGEIQTSTKYTTVRLVNLTLSLNGYSVNNHVKIGESFNIGYRIAGINGAKTVTLYADGIAVNTQTATSSDEVKNFTVSTTGMSHGTHNFQLLAEYKISETESVFSNLIYIAVPIIGEEDTPAFGCVFNMEGHNTPLINTLPRLEVQQYNLFSIEYFVYDSSITRSVDFYSQETLIGNYLISDDFVKLTYKYSDTGSKLCSFVCGNTTYQFYIDILESDYQVTDPSGMSLYLNALGKSNSSANRDSWNYNDITSTFEGFRWGGDGWTDVIIKESDNLEGTQDETESALRLIGGDKVTINYKPLERTSQSKNAFACSFKFKVSNAMDESEELISCVDENGTGFIIKANEAIFNTKEDKSVSTKFASGEIYNIGFVSFPETSYDKVNSNRIYLYINGIICGTVARPSTDSIYQEIPSNIVIQSKYCTLDIFSIRIYNQQLSDEQMFDAYLVDLNNAEMLANEYTSNDVLDFNGNVSVEGALKCGIPYMVLTGQFGSLHAIDHVAADNNKNNKFKIDQILYVEGENSPRNFVSVKGEDKPILRIQGTSSTKYSRKNYRIYTKNTNLYLGCDKNGEGGELQDSPKWAISDTAAPVNCWCLKADYAESSSSHNTGFANLVHDLLTDKEIDSLTPPQEYKNDNYKYDVRTTVEGHPCLLFARKTVNDTPEFVGKFNLNNDKSTEDVFGFLNIDGYHKDSPWTEDMSIAAINSLEFPEDFTSITVDDEIWDKQRIINEIINNNPTECWEFSNNENPFGQFKEIDFNKIITETKEIEDKETGEIKTETVSYYQWFDCWEARFPDEDVLNAAFEAGVKPKYLRLIAEWLMSTDSTIATNESITPVTYGGITYNQDTPAYRRAKFSAEVGNYFNINFLCDYYTLNDLIAGADQRVKNMMWAFWYDPDANNHVDADGQPLMGKMRCYPIYYDNDTILGVDNSGAITINWDADENTKYPNGTYVFAGHDSVVWDNVRHCLSSELKASYRKLRKVMDAIFMKKYFNDKQSEVYGEVVFNKDTLYKYVTPTAIGTPTKSGGVTIWADQASFVHGSRKAHRDWFIGKRMGLFDNRFATGDFISNSISWKGPLSRIPSISLVSDKDHYYAVSSDSINVDMTHQYIKEGETFSYTATDKPGPGAIVKLYGVDGAKELNLGTWGGFSDIQFVGKYNSLEKLTLGSAESDPIVQPAIVIGSSMPFLKYLDITNTTGGMADGSAAKFTNLDVSECMQLETLIANLCPNLRTINFAQGGAIKDITLPTGYENLYLRSLPNLTNSGIKYESNASTIKELVIENCEKINSIELLNNIMNVENSKLSRIRITGLNLKGNGQDLIEIMNKGLKGIDSTGTSVDKCTLVGTYQLTTLLEESVYNQLCEYFELSIIQPEYTTISFDLSNSTSEKVTNYDNNTGIAFGNTYSPSGHITRILNKRHSYLVKNQGEGVFAAMQLSDTNSNIYFEDETTALLNGTEGDYCMYEPHYWYKGINDHMNRKMYVLFSSNEECPKQADGLKITLADCTSHKNKRVNASTSSSETNVLVDNTVANISAYSYIIPQDKQYKQIRVSSIANPSTGCVIVDSEGNILSRLYADSSKGMHNASYLFGNLPEKAYKVYFTIDTDYPQDYYIYLTESTDLEAIEPDWVEHKECFVGRVMSTLYNGDVKSAIYPDINNSSWGKGYYPMDAHGTAVTSICSELSGKAKGYYAADYEVLKDIVILAYAKYGGTGLHSNYVGAGANESGEFNRNSRYFFNGIDYTTYGVMDTLTSGTYDSYYTGSIENQYPMVPTLLGYHQFIGRGTTTSVNDIVSIVNKTYSNSRTSRSVKLQSIDNTKYSTYITGGRYVDLFPAKEDTGGASTAGFCGRWTGSSLSSGSAFIEFGHDSGSTTPVSYNISLASSSVTQTVTYNSLKNLQRILIVPDQINIFTDSNLFKQV